MPDQVWIKASRPGKCAECEEPIQEGDKALYEVNSHTQPGGRKVYCEPCGNQIKE